MAEQRTPKSIETEKQRFFYGYVVVAVAFSIQLITWGTFNTFGIFFNPLQTEFGWSRAAISGAASLSMFLCGFVGIIVGSLNDRFGPRLVITACGFFFCLGYLLMSGLNTIWQLYLFYGLMIGIGMSGTDVVLLSTIARWFVKKRGMMSGIMKVGTGVGMVIVPLVASRLIIVYDWRMTYAILSAIALIFVISFAQFLRRDPAQMQQLAYGEEANAGSLNSVEGGLYLREAIHTRQFWTICVVNLIFLLCAMTIVVHIVPHALDLGISATNAAIVLSIIGGASIVGRFMMGSLGDIVGNEQAVIICFLTLVVAVFWLQLAKELWMLYLFAVVYGFSHGGFVTLISPTVAGFFGTRSHGLIFGVVFFSGTIGGTIGPVLAGHIFDVTNSYEIAFLTLTFLSITGLVLSMSLRPTGRGRGGG